MFSTILCSIHFLLELLPVIILCQVTFLWYCKYCIFIHCSVFNIVHPLLPTKLVKQKQNSLCKLMFQQCFRISNFGNTTSLASDLFRVKRTVNRVKIVILKVTFLAYVISTVKYLFQYEHFHFVDCFLLENKFCTNMKEMEKSQ